MKEILNSFKYFYLLLRSVLDPRNIEVAAEECQDIHHQQLKAAGWGAVILNSGIMIAYP
jgi:hypothetical protein